MNARLHDDIQKSLDLLEWPRLLGVVQDECPTLYGRSEWAKTPFLHDDQLQTAQQDVDILRHLIVRYGEPITAPKGEISEVRPTLKRLEKEGVLSLKEVVDLYIVLDYARGFMGHLLKFLDECLDSFPQYTPSIGRTLKGLSSPVAWCRYLEEKVTPEGNIRDNASPELAQLTKRAKSQQQEILTTLQRMLATPTVQKALQDPMYTMRNDRYVLPVNVFYKTSVPGIVQDVSSSGNTVFIEPKRVVELSNRLAETRKEIQKEIERILKTISADLHIHAFEMHRTLDTLATTERVWSAARLARRLDAAPIRLRDTPDTGLDVKGLKHPLLCLQEGKENIIPSDVALGHGARTMMITGPNTGGKTVLLKSVGLAVLMTKAGMLPLVDDGSWMTPFDDVLADIGDSQSIQQNLSTFSGQMTRLARFASEDVSLERRLILLDEIAAGTDPVEGSALAKAILARFYDKGACTMVTTHLGVLKLEADAREGYVNACVAFDVESMSPTYKLLTGIPGASNAIAIARKLGLDEDLLATAEAHMGGQETDASKLLTTLETQKRETAEAHTSITAKEAELNKRLAELKSEQQAFLEKKKQLLTDYQKQFKARLRGFEEQAKRLKKELKQAEVAPEKLRFARQRIHHLGSKLDEQFDAQLSPIETEIESTKPQQIVHTFDVGQPVSCDKVQGTAIIEAISADGKKLTIKAGNLKAVVKKSDVTPLAVDGSQARKKAEQRKIVKRIQKQNAEQRQRLPHGRFETECDVRGMRAQEALEKMQEFLDNAVLVGLETVGVIHGQGTGALKKAVREYLKTYKQVRDYYPEQAHLGGDGKTIIEMQ